MEAASLGSRRGPVPKRLQQPQGVAPGGGARGKGQEARGKGQEARGSPPDRQHDAPGSDCELGGHDRHVVLDMAAVWIENVLARQSVHWALPLTSLY